MDELAGTLFLIGLIVAPVYAVWRITRLPAPEPMPEVPLDPSQLQSPAHQLYVQGDGDALLEVLPGLSVDEFVPFATALGRYREVDEHLKTDWRHLLEPQARFPAEAAQLLRINAAETSSELGRFDEARGLLSHRSENPFLETGRRCTLAWVLTLEGRAEEAAAELEGLDAAALGAQYAAELHLTRAFAAMARARLDEAKTALREARFAAVRSSTVRNLLCMEAELAWREGRREDGLKLFEEAAAHHWRWQGGYGLLRWGELLAELGRAEEARAAWTRCTTQDPESLAAAQARSKLGL